MKQKIFMPKYMVDFKCVSSKCIDTCCAGWDINIDRDTYLNYSNSSLTFKELVNGKFIKNDKGQNYFNHGFMKLIGERTCPFLNESMLCDIHEEVGEENLCITCKSYPRVYNLVDGVYEKSGLPSCYEVCVKGFLNKDKMEFVEIEEEINEKSTEIRRVIDSEAYEGTDSLLQFFWDIRVISINIIQSRSFTIEERLNILKNFYENIERMHYEEDYDSLEDLIEDFNNKAINYEEIKGQAFNENNKFYISLANEELIKNIKSIKLNGCVDEYKLEIMNEVDICDHLKEMNKSFYKVDKFHYILENYLVNQIFKDLIPFNKGEGLMKSINGLINSYRIIKAYVIGIALNAKEEVTEKQIIRVIQALSKDIEHNMVFKELLENSSY
ncbi:flagellin lysine-N-methylase [Clostridium sp. LP20]|uniref:flagellin lysine-N-methylase n=1 Tax=Clostridium sp. LP20 TaxID=3418665 RepID=UPI003EE778D7